MTTLTSGGNNLEQTEINISSLIDTWLLVRDIESGERNRGLYVLKSRGMAHSNQIESSGSPMRGSNCWTVTSPGRRAGRFSRLAQESKAQADEAERRDNTRHRYLEVEAERRSLAAQVAALEAKIRCRKRNAGAGIQKRRKANAAKPAGGDGQEPACDAPVTATRSRRGREETVRSV